MLSYWITRSHTSKNSPNNDRIAPRDMNVAIHSPLPVPRHLCRASARTPKNSPNNDRIAPRDMNVAVHSGQPGKLNKSFFTQPGKYNKPG